MHSFICSLQLISSLFSSLLLLTDMTRVIPSTGIFDTKLSIFPLLLVMYVWNDAQFDKMTSWVMLAWVWGCWMDCVALKYRNTRSGKLVSWDAVGIIVLQMVRINKFADYKTRYAKGTGNSDSCFEECREAKRTSNNAANDWLAWGCSSEPAKNGMSWMIVPNEYINQEGDDELNRW